MLSAGLTQRYFPAARGSGIPQAIAARILRDEESRQKLLGIRIAVAKVVLTLVGLLAGASIGREGPSVQIGASIMLFCAALGGISSQRGIVLAGAAAGVAAAFNTPLAGIIFAIEEMARAFEHRNSSIVLIAIVLSGAAAISILGNYEYFGHVQATLALGSSWSAIIGIGLTGGLLGSLFARSIIDGEPYLRRRLARFGMRGSLLLAAACGLGVALIGILTDGLTFGSGYTLGYGLLHQELAAAWWQMPAKWLATVLSSLSGIPGGIFAPSLSIGAGLGADIGHWTPDLPLGAIIVLGMVGYFTGVVQAPITAVVIVMEITDNQALLIPLMATALIAFGTSRMVCPVPFYRALSVAFLKREKRRQERV